MLHVLFHLDDQRYALETGRLVEVVPFVELRELPRAPACVAGLFDYRGRMVPVIDLTALALGRPSRVLHSTRILLIDYPLAEGGSRPLGLLAERVVETLKLAPEAFTDAGVEIPEAHYLGRVAHDERGLLQAIETDALLTPEVEALLFQDAATCS
ncbi:chemotaxis protein CheW [Thiohalobacter thiocyanaticus]|uniref:Purine-binding chemotaxis protein CheW n=1 Tax=Thiohalobacter thiocyanaticus TaxID=585455 RepID=A0A426QLR2_9GAMM|nr:chemotaxis protein CheW [Thiohalobacter thiocyanaticus]RRQ22713.1 purine-binding chemotaxis protein CheW [Thiohalobacter thiocyanaticus]